MADTISILKADPAIINGPELAHDALDLFVFLGRINPVTYLNINGNPARMSVKNSRKFGE